MARVCKKWRLIAYDTRLWKYVSLRPEISGLHVGSYQIFEKYMNFAIKFIHFNKIVI